MENHLSESGQVKEERISPLRFAEIVDIADDAIISVNSNQRITLFNRGAEKIFGYKSTEVLGQPLDLLIPTRFVVAHRQHIVTFASSSDMARRMGDRQEIFGRRKDGTEFPAEASISKLDLGSEKIFTVILRDITERKQIREALEAQVTRLRSLTHLNQLISASLDMNHVLREIAKAAATLVPVPLVSFWLVDEEAQTLHLLTFSDETLGADFSARSLHFDRSAMGWVVRNRSALSIPDVFIDGRISDLAWWERHQFRSCVEIPILFGEKILGVLVLIGQQPLQFAPEEQELLQNFVAQAAIAIENARLFQEIQEQALTLAQTNTTLQKEIAERLRAEHELRKAHDELEKRVQERTAELEKVNEALYAEIAEHQRIEKELRQTAIRLARSNAELEQFAYVASHDLQEPLRHITNYTQLLAERYRGQLDAKADIFIKYIIEGAARMQGLIKDLLLYSRVGRKQVPFEPINMEELLRQTFIDLESVIVENEAVITFDPLPTVQAIPSQLRHLLQNLLSNALKFRSSQPPRVHLSAEQKGDLWVFSVQDNGIGIDPQYRERIFVMFQRLHTKTEYPGNGIGLAICKKIVEHHGGEIWVESAPGKGATFYFTLPVKPPHT